MLGVVAGPAERALDFLRAAVDGREWVGADGEGIVLVVGQGDRVAGGLVADLQNLARLGRHLGFGAQFQQTPCEWAGRFEVFQLKRQTHGRAERQDLMDRLEVAVGEISRQLEKKRSMVPLFSENISNRKDSNATMVQ